MLQISGKSQVRGSNACVGADTAKRMGIVLVCFVAASGCGVEAGETPIVPDGCSAKDATGGAFDDDDSLASLQGVTSISGGLTIGGGVTSTKSLRCLTAINGELRVTATALERLELAELQEVGTVLIAQTPVLSSINLGGLTTIGGLNGESMRVENAPALESLNVKNLPEMDGLVLQSLGSDTDAAMTLSFDALRSLGSLWSRGVNGIETLDWENLESVSGELRIEQSGRLKSIELGHLSEVGTVLIAQTPVLSSINLGGLTTIGGLNGESMRVENAPALESLNVKNLPEMDGLVLQSLGSDTDAAMTLSFDALRSLGSLWSRGVNGIETLDWENLESVSGELRIEQSGRLKSIELGHLSEVGTVLIAQTPVLSSINLGGLTTIGGLNGESMRVENAPALESLNVKNLPEMDGLVLQSLGAVDQQFALDFAALSQLGGLYLKATSLAELDGFENVSSVTGELTITGNFALSNCLAKEFAERVKKTDVANISYNMEDPECAP